MYGITRLCIYELYQQPSIINARYLLATALIDIPISIPTPKDPVNPLISTPDHVFLPLPSAFDPPNAVLRDEVLVRTLTYPLSNRHLEDAVEALEIPDVVFGGVEGRVMLEPVEHV